MTAFKLLLAAGSVMVLSACASTPAVPPPTAVVDLSGKTCTATPALKDAISLTPEKKEAYYVVSTPVDAAKPCLTADNASSNYVVYAIPAHGENHTITVGGLQEAVRTFAPSVSLLDTDGKVTRTFTDDRFANLGNILGVQFRPVPNERYILVQSNPKLVGKSISTFSTRIAATSGYSPATAYSYGYSYQMQRGVEGTQSRVFSHEGSVEVVVQAATGKIGLPDEK